VLPSAESAIALAVSLDQEAAERYIAEEDMWALNDSHRRSYRMIESASLAIQEYLGARGHEVATPYPNFAYRDEPRTRDMVPPLSHKYVCTAAGVGWIGWSENLLTREYGALVTLGSVVTSAVLKPSPMVEEDWCSNCKICVATCPTHYMPKQEEDVVEIGGVESHYSHRRSAMRCTVSCGGCNNKRKESSKWSTWSPRVMPNMPGVRESEEAFDDRCDEDVAENRIYKAHFLKMFVYLCTTDAVMPHPQPRTGKALDDRKHKSGEVRRAGNGTSGVINLSTFAAQGQRVKPQALDPSYGRREQSVLASSPPASIAAPVSRQCSLRGARTWPPSRSGCAWEASSLARFFARGSISTPLGSRMALTPGLLHSRFHWSGLPLHLQESQASPEIKVPERSVRSRPAPGRSRSQPVQHRNCRRCAAFRAISAQFAPEVVPRAVTADSPPPESGRT